MGRRPSARRAIRAHPIKNGERAVRAFVLAVQRDERLREARMLVRMSLNRLYVEANAQRACSW